MDPLRSVVIPVLSRLYCHLHPVVIVVIRAAGGYDALLKVVTDAIAAKKRSPACRIIAFRSNTISPSPAA